MTKKLFFVILVVALIALDSTADSTNRLHFPVAGFTIEPLEAPPGESPQEVLLMLLPPTEGFAANVNVQIQPYAGTVEDYVALSLQQFKSAGLTVLEQKISAKSVAVFEYTGKIQGALRHCYARAEKSGGNVYLATGTATPAQWDKEADRIKSCVDSFRCERGASPSASPARR
jgi:hypothetical protein